MTSTALAFLNRKGGVGKTSTVFHLAGALALAGDTVLVVDNDPQASLTQGFIGPDATADLEPSATIAAAYGADRPSLESLAIPTGIAGIDLVPGCLSLDDFNSNEPKLDRVTRRLAEVLDGARRRYAWTLIDCPPNLLHLSTAALAAADYVVVPVQAEDFGAQGITAVQAAIGDVRRRLNPSLSLLGYLVTMFDARPALPRFYLDELRKAYGEDVFDELVPRSIDFAESILRRRPITHHRPAGKGAVAIGALALEVAARVALAEAGLAVSAGNAEALASLEEGGRV